MSNRLCPIRPAVTPPGHCAATAALCAGLAIALAATPPAQSQETTSQLNGFVVEATGKPVLGAQVTIVHVPTGTTTSLTTTASGQFSATGLRIGGPYRITATAAGMQQSEFGDLYTKLAGRTSVTLIAQPITELAGVEVIAEGERDVTIGAGSRYSARDIRVLPSISRDIKDVVRVDPKVWIDATNSDAMAVAGVNNRYNSITIDGVRQSDDFGLNNNGYPTQRSPLSIDAIEAVSILAAPFSVEYGHFRGSTINIVTKSGTNEFSGSAFYYHGNDSLAGDRSKGRDFTIDFNEETFGATLGGPIIRDRLFFFLSYEKLDRAAPQDYGPTGSGASIEVPGVTQAEYDQVVRIARDVYGFDPGQRLDRLPEADRKVLGKIDWNISDSQRVSLAYQDIEGNEVITNNNSPSSHTISTPSGWYNRAIKMDSMSLQLYSDWNERFSTEAKLAHKQITTRQDSLRGTDFAEMQVTTPAGGVVFVGPDENRHANYLTNDLDAIKLKADFSLGDHTLTAGYEREMLDIFNIFLPRSSGQYFFSSIAEFQARTADRLVYNNAYTNVKTDGGASFGYDVDSVYLQDEWRVTPALRLQAGVRLDRWSSDDEPLLNANFTGRYGYSNQSTLDGRKLIMPRIGFSWQWRPETTIYGGFGLFGGGSPNVWVANSFSTDGVTVVQQTIDSESSAPLAAGLRNVDGYQINPAILANHALMRGDAEVNAVDPSFEVPSQYRWNFGLKQTLPWDIEWTADIILSRVKDEVLWKDLRLAKAGTAPDGRPQYAARADTSVCNPPLTGSCIRPPGQDLLLTNTHRGSGTVLTTDFSKTWRTRAGRIDAYLGYGYQDIQDVNSGTSSTARSNWDSYALADPNNPELATSNYEIRHQFKGALTWRKAFFAGYETSLSLIGERRSGRPFSYTFGHRPFPESPANVWGDPRQQARQHQLFYVPSGPDDVTYEVLCTEANVTAGITGCGSITDVNAEASMAFGAATEAFIEQHGLDRYRGHIVPRNSHRSPWLSLLDLRLAQELPVRGRSRGVLTLDVENLANMIDHDWGQLRQVSFIHVAPVLEIARIDDATGRYVYRPRTGATGPTPPDFSVSALPSVWRVQLGVRFEF